MIVVRIAEGAWHHAGVRFSEWVGGVSLGLMGYMFLIQPDIFVISPSFKVMAQWASQEAWANVLLAASLIRIIALVINGSIPFFRPYSPTFRFTASWVAFMTWSAMALGFFYAWQDGTGSPSGVVAYGVFIASHELRNIVMTRRDMIAVKRNANALARKQ